MPSVGSLLINEILPPEYRDYNRVLDKKGLKKLLSDVAQKNPEKYSEILGKLGRMGAQFAQRSGGYSLATDLLQTPEVTKKHRARLQAKLRSIYENDNLTSKQKDERVTELMVEGGEKLREELYKHLQDTESPIALMVDSGAKGNRFAASAGVGFDSLYTGANEKPVPFPVLHNYSEGLNPFEYWAASFGARRGVTDTKLSVASGGFLAKQLAQVSHKGVISADDYPEGAFKPGVGLPGETNDSDNIGRLLAQDIGGYKRNSVITDSMLKDLQNRKIENILVRSPMVGGPANGSLYARDVGMTERQRLPVMGENPGITASQSLSEPITQSLLCLEEDTLVRMADFSTKKIKDIQIGDYVLGVDNDLVGVPTRVTGVFDNGLKECWKTEFAVGQSKDRIYLVSTLDHKILAEVHKVKWAWPRVKGAKTCTTEVDTGEFPVGEKCYSFGAKCLRGTYPFTGAHEPMALLLGLLLGDGCYVRSVNGVYFSCHDDCLIEELADYMRSVCLKIAELRNHYGYYRISGLSDDYYTNRCVKTGKMLPGRRNIAVKKLEELGMLYKYAYEKTIPNEVFTWDKQSIANLIGGFFITDGSVYLPKQKGQNVMVQMGSTSLEMVEQLRLLLEVYFGIMCSKVYMTNSGRKRPLYNFKITKRRDVLAFYREIPIYGVKSKTFKMLLDSTVDPATERRHFYRQSQHLVGQRNTFDIEVESPNHLFVLANGLIVHNSSKHTGGIFSGSAPGISGFKKVNQMLQVPSIWEGAVHSQEDGRVTDISADELGNQIIKINGQEHIIPRTNKVIVKKGDEIEAGDVLSDGLPNPAEVVHHKGVGEGRRYFTQVFNDVLKQAGVNTSKRNVEMLAKGLIDHLKIDEEHGDYLPGDTVSYAQYESEYEPREDSAKGRPEYFANQYLEQPILHYTIGTKLRPSVLANLKKYGIKEVMANKNPPRFHSDMVRAMANTSVSNDWLTRMGGSYQRQGLLSAAQRGMTADPGGPSFYSAVVGRTDFTKPSSAIPNPIIKSILPNLPKQQITPPSYEVDNDVADWLNTDG